MKLKKGPTLLKLLVQLYTKVWEVNLYNDFSIFTILCQNGYEAVKKLYSKVTRSLSTNDIYNCQQGKSNGSEPYHVFYQ